MFVACTAREGRNAHVLVGRGQVGRADEAQRVQEERLRDELNDTQTQLNEQHSAMLERLER